MTDRKFFKIVAYWSIVALCILSIGGASATFGYQHAGEIKSGDTEIAGGESISKILSLLETRGSDKKVLHKAAEKLLTLPEHQLRMMSSLCDRISGHDDTAGANIAFSLISAMIILS